MILRQRLTHIFARDLLAIVISALVILGAGAWAAYQFVRPAPPDTLVIATGAQQGAYQLYTLRSHIDMVRKQLVAPDSGAAPT